MHLVHSEADVGESIQKELWCDKAIEHRDRVQGNMSSTVVLKIAVFRIVVVVS